MAEDKMQSQRLELKYLITEDTAARIQDYVSSFLELDEFGATRPGHSYPVHSLYLDSDDLRTYWETINGTKNRFKLRLRFYENRPGVPVYFEIKRRMNNCILKQRGGVRREHIDWLLSGHIPEMAHLTSNNPKQLVALQNFCQRMTTLNAKPKAHIAYMREAWVSPHDNSVRVTMDRDVKCQFDPTTYLDTNLKNPSWAFGSTVILEIKFTINAVRNSLWEREDSYIMDFKPQAKLPPWFPDLIRCFNLIQTGAAKYVDGVTAVGEELFHNTETIFASRANLGANEAMKKINGSKAPVSTGASVEQSLAASPKGAA
jgi:SPX domain protein involved in polyphosphate accumulation